ncbi:MAG: DUF2267 domain-containing protein [Trueperaceae bacterium]|nr:DUF2267 domain-containing protein [Trueperaceae bacterium]
MSNTGLETFDSTLQLTNEWLNDINDKLGFGDKQLAYHALRATLHALRDRIPTQEAIEFGAQLPMLVRGFYYEGWNPVDNPSKERNLDEFVAHIEQSYDNRTNIDLAEMASAVFSTVNERMTAGQVTQVRDMLNEDLRQIWPEPVATGA